MNNYLYIIPLLPLTGFLLLSLFGSLMNKSLVAIVGAGSITLSAIVVILIALNFDPGSPVKQTLWQWFATGDMNVSISLSVDALTLVFLFVITFVGALIHIYSAAFM